MKHFILTLLAVATLWACSDSEVKEATVPLVLVQKAALSDDGGSVSYPGQIKGQYESVLSFQTGGKISSRNVRMGDSVRNGDVLMSIDPVDIREALNISEAQLMDAKARLNLAETEHQRQTALFQEEVVSRARFDQSLTTLETARTGYQQSEARYKQQLNLLEYTVLRSESDGVITELSAEIGQVVAAGQPVLGFVRSGSLEVEIHVPESSDSTLREGMAATVSLWAAPKEQQQAVIREISPSADPYTRTFKVRAELIDPPSWVKLGMTASVTIQRETQGTTYAVPSTAIYNSEGKSYVWVVSADSSVHLREVVIDKYENTVVRIRSGLSSDDNIVVSGVHKLFENQTVRTDDNSI